jgi:hypothetical protein
MAQTNAIVRQAFESVFPAQENEADFPNEGL